MEFQSGFGLEFSVKDSISLFSEELEMLAKVKAPTGDRGGQDIAIEESTIPISIVAKNIPVKTRQTFLHKLIKFFKCGREGKLIILENLSKGINLGIAENKLM